MNTTLQGATVVNYCSECGHVQTDPLIDLKAYYEETYEVGRLNENDDQLYTMDGEKPIYRAEHQARVACQKLAMTEGVRVLDYGCGKSLTMMRICKIMPSLQPFLYDVSDKYLPIWSTFTRPEHCFVRQIPDSAKESFDVVTSFYALEHISGLQESLQSIRDCLKPGGVFYFIVPNVLVNLADFIVADHVNHFLPSSLQAMLKVNGFECIEVDESVHFAAYVVTARKAAGVITTAAFSLTSALQGSHDYPVDESEKDKLYDISEFWTSQQERLTTRLDSLPVDSSVAIYGAGFYGTYLRGLLEASGRTPAIIVDQNPFLQGTRVAGVPVVSPHELPEFIDTLLVGLNPQSAKQIIQGIDCWQGRTLDCIYLE
jgi:2-polyprenyl-3-methyl-5-hydroxy-6-metoxy-1,4-benzoquinol methylase